MTTALAHDLIVAAFLLCGLWALGSLAREEFERIQRARRIFRKWRDLRRNA